LSERIENNGASPFGFKKTDNFAVIVKEPLFYFDNR
jgi:hypothetical protein